MNLKTINFLAPVLALVVLASCGSKKEGIKISGQITNPIADAQVIVSQYTVSGLEPIDTLEVDESGVFSEYFVVKEPSFFKVNVQGRRFFSLVLNGTEKKVNIEIDIEDQSIPPVVEGSPETQHILAFDRMIQGMKEDQELLNQQAMEARRSGDDAEFKAVSDEFMTLFENFNGQLKDYALDAAPSLAVFYGISVLKPEDHMPFFKQLSEIYSKELPDHFFTKDLNTSVNYLSKLSVGVEAPEISLPNPDGEIITLSSLRGNYVLIDFWAGWCRPCRMENPNVLRMYKQYSDKNFEILGVSLDRNRESWVKAIEADGLIWKHVSDLKYFNSEAAQEYQIQSIPATYLIDPEGKIIAKGLRGPSLEAKLKEIFG